MFRVCVAAAVLFSTVCSSTAALKTELVVRGLSRPVFVCSPPGDTNRIFILEQHVGAIRIFDFRSGTLNSNTFLVVPSIARGNEQGLLGLAFHPNYQNNGHFYVNITSSSGGRTDVIRFTANGDPATTTTADRNSAKTILSFSQPESNHNGGWMGFGPDGYLYISSGDGGGGNDQHGSYGNAQNRSNLLGKILRIDVNGGDPYSIPESNPYKEHATFREEIWAFGLRNPWRCSFDSVTGHLWIGDVGQGAREEIDVIPVGVGGLNFGWRPREGTIQTPGIPTSERPVTDAINPVFEYPRSQGYSVTGGYVYRGNSAPEIYGKYIFADYGTARFWALTPDASGTNGTTVQITGLTGVRGISSFGVDGRGELYVCDMTDGEVFRILSDTPVVRLAAAAAQDNQFVLTVEAAAGREHLVEMRSPLEGGGQWTAFETIPSAPTNRVVSITNSVTQSEQYFRVRLP